MPSINISARKQQKQTWNTIADADGQRQWPSYTEILKDVRHSDYNEILTCPFDFHPGNKDPQSSKNICKRRLKTICPNGVVCCAKMEIFPFPEDHGVGGSPYTGLLTPGTTVENCLIRLSSAAQPLGQKNLVNRRVAQTFLGAKLVDAKIFPAVAVKCFRSNTESANILCMGSKVGQTEDNFFAHCVSTQVTSRMPVTLKPILRIFKKYSRHPLALGLSNLCRYDTNGEVCDNLNFPFCLTLKPCSKGSNRMDTTAVQDERPDDAFLDTLRSIPSGTVLYDIFASPDPLSVVDSKALQRIGRIVTTSQMKVSPPDDGLFFRHQRKDDDFALRPHWEKYLKTAVSLKDGTRGTAATLAGWELFEHQIQQGDYIDFEKLGKSEKLG